VQEADAKILQVGGPGGSIDRWHDGGASHGLQALDDERDELTVVGVIETGHERDVESGIVDGNVVEVDEWCSGSTDLVACNSHTEIVQLCQNGSGVLGVPGDVDAVDGNAQRARCHAMST